MADSVHEYNSVSFKHSLLPCSKLQEKGIFMVRLVAAFMSNHLEPRRIQLVLASYMPICDWYSKDSQ